MPFRDFKIYSQAICHHLEEQEEGKLNITHSFPKPPSSKSFWLHCGKDLAFLKGLHGGEPALPDGSPQTTAVVCTQRGTLRKCTDLSQMTGKGCIIKTTL